MLYHCEPSEQSLNMNIKMVLNIYYRRVRSPESGTATAQKIVYAFVMLFEKVCQQFLPTPSRSHSTFYLRDLAHVFINIGSARRRSSIRPS
jgi:hypothetical protein